MDSIDNVVVGDHEDNHEEYIHVEEMKVNMEIDVADTVTSVVPKYGLMPDGSYSTPFDVTVVYDPNSLFESAIAGFAYRAQLCPLGDAVDYGVVADSVEFLTPNVFIFGTKFEPHHLASFYARGFTTIHIFPYQPITKYDGLPSVYLVTLPNLYSHINIESSIGLHTIEHICCAKFNFQSSFVTDAIEGGRYLARAISKPYVDTFIKMNSVKGWNILEELIAEGKYVGIAREKMVNNLIDTAEIVKCNGVDESSSHTIILVPNTLRNVFMHLLPMHPRSRAVNYYIFYNLTQTINVTIGTLANTTESADSLLRRLGTFISGNQTIATGTLRDLSMFV